jgi:hypothetical protein
MGCPYLLAIKQNNTVLAKAQGLIINILQNTALSLKTVKIVACICFYCLLSISS